MTLEEVRALRAKWEKDAGVAAKDVVKLCDFIESIFGKQDEEPDSGIPPEIAEQLPAIIEEELGE